MSLKAFEQAWIESLLNPGDRHWHQLTPSERASLEALSPETLAGWREQAQTQRRDLLATALPRRIRQLLGEAHSADLLAALQNHPDLPPQYPRHELISFVLNHLLSVQTLSLPHLRDLVSYELAAVRLVFFGLPQAAETLKGPRLATWARLIRLGEQFPTVLESLNQGHPVDDLPDMPTRRFLLTRDFGGLRLETLPPGVLACLERCDGSRPWSELSAEVMAQQTLREDPPLGEWLEHFLRRGVLLAPSTNSSD